MMRFRPGRLIGKVGLQLVRWFGLVLFKLQYYDFFSNIIIIIDSYQTSFDYQLMSFQVWAPFL